MNTFGELRKSRAEEAGTQTLYKPKKVMNHFWVPLKVWQTATTKAVSGNSKKQEASFCVTTGANRREERCITQLSDANLSTPKPCGCEYPLWNSLPSNQTFWCKRSGRVPKWPLPEASQTLYNYLSISIPEQKASLFHLVMMPARWGTGLTFRSAPDNRTTHPKISSKEGINCASTQLAWLGMQLLSSCFIVIPGC